MTSNRNQPAATDRVLSRPYLRVQMRPTPPRRWQWCLHVDGIPGPIRTSDPVYRSAEEAWEAGRRALDQSAGQAAARG